MRFAQYSFFYVGGQISGMSLNRIQTEHKKRQSKKGI